MVIFFIACHQLTQLQSGNDKAPGTLSTPWKQSQTPMYGQVNLHISDHCINSSITGIRGLLYYILELDLGS